MKYSQNNARQLITLILSLAGLISWNFLLTVSSANTAQANVRMSVTRLAAQSSGGVANGKIAFTVNAKGTNQIYTMNSDGAARTQMTFEKDGAWSPRWSPDGARIAYARGTGGGNSELFVMSADGSN